MFFFLQRTQQIEECSWFGVQVWSSLASSQRDASIFAPLSFTREPGDKQDARCCGHYVSLWDAEHPTSAAEPYILLWVRCKRKAQQQFDVTAGWWRLGQTVKTAPGVSLPLKPRTNLSIWTKVLSVLILAHIINMANCTVQLNCR